METAPQAFLSPKPSLTALSQRDESFELKASVVAQLSAPPKSNQLHGEYVDHDYHPALAEGNSFDGEMTLSKGSADSGRTHAASPVPAIKYSAQDCRNDIGHVGAQANPSRNPPPCKNLGTKTREYYNCVCNNCAERNRSVYVRVCGPPIPGRKIDIETSIDRVWRAMAAKFGPVERVDRKNETIPRHYSQSGFHVGSVLQLCWLD